MFCHLLYKDREWGTQTGYVDTSSIVGDLGLKTIFSLSGKTVVWEQQQVKKIEAEDKYLVDVMRKVMTVPLHTEEEIRYRQRIAEDCIENPGFVHALYQTVTDLTLDWDKLGRKNRDKGSGVSPAAGLLRDIQVLSLFVEGLSAIKEIIKVYNKHFSSPGLKEFSERLCHEFSDVTQQDLCKVLQDIAFYTQSLDKDNTLKNKIGRPEISLECGIGDGLKFTDIKLERVSTVMKKYRNPNGTVSKLQDYVTKLTPGSILVQKSVELKNDTANLEFQIVRYIVNGCNGFVGQFINFFDQLRLQIAFYRGILNLREHMLRYDLRYCFPTVGSQEELSFQDLKELVMCMEQRIKTIGNSSDIKGKRLLVITGANQGGKSTFLRSIGIAQIMMQCGMPVAAERYCSGIYPRLFTHFTRREDSAMNSGRLDDELRRMNQIVEHVGEGSLVLLNESFATTTEKEGSVIAYEIMKALVEHGVRVFTVTHLLSFAQKVYDENRENPDSKVAFLSAERLEDGRRTFKMIQHAPELTSFGLDLYEEIVGKF